MQPNQSRERVSVVLRILVLAVSKSLRQRWGDDIEMFLACQRAEPKYSQRFVGTIRFYKDVVVDILSSRIARGKGSFPRQTHRSAFSLVRTDNSTPKPASLVSSILGGVLYDCRYAIRALFRSPLFTVTAVATLAVGIGANVAVFSVLDAALLRPLPYPDSERLVYGRATFGTRINTTVSYLDYIDFRDRSETFEQLALVRSGLQWFPIYGIGEPERISGNWITVDFFDALGVDPFLGRNFHPEEGEPGAPDVALISYGYWQRRFGASPDIIGQTISIEGYVTTIVGVMPDDYRFRYDADIWLPIRDGYMDTGGRTSHSWQIVGRLNPGVSIEQAQAQIDVIARQLGEEYPESHQDKGLLLTRLDEALVEGYRPSLLLLMTATGLVLLIACANVANLLMARGSSRKSELSARAALGASRGRLIRQCMVESFLLALIGGTIGVLLALWLQRLIITFLPMETLGIGVIGLSIPMLGFALFASFLTAAAFGLGPAITTSLVEPATALSSGQRSSARGRAARIRSGLVVLQVALTVILVVASGLLLRSFTRLNGVDVGLDPTNVLTARVQISSSEYDAEERTRFFHSLLERIRTMPGVEAASAISHIPVLHPFMDCPNPKPPNP